MSQHPPWPWALAAALIVGAAPAAAQGPGAPTPAAATASAATDPLRAWREANDLVGGFRRGHIDWLRWEATQGAAAASPLAAESGPAGPLLALEQARQAIERALRQRGDLLAPAQASPAEQGLADQGLAAAVHEVSQAWVQAVSAQTQARLSTALLDVVQTADELAQRMVAVGNWPRLRGIEQQLRRGEAERQALDAAETQATGLEQLTRLVGWRGDPTSLLLPSALPDVPPSPGPRELPDVLAKTLAAHPRWQSQKPLWQRAQAGANGEALRIWQARQERAWQAAWADVVPAQPMAAPTQAPRLRPPPDHRTEAAAEAQAEQAQWALRLASQVRHTMARASTAEALWRHWQQQLPLHQARFEEIQLRHNGMLLSTWDLLQAREQVLQAEMSLHKAWRDAWLAHIDLLALMGGVEQPLPEVGASRPGSATASAAKAPH